MGPIWGWQDQGGPHVVPMNLTIWEVKLQGHKFELYKKYEHKFTFSHTFLNTEMTQVVKTFLMDYKDQFIPHTQIPWLLMKWEYKLSNLHNGISYTGKMTSLYWIMAQEG